MRTLILGLGALALCACSTASYNTQTNAELKTSCSQEKPDLGACLALSSRYRYGQSNTRVDPIQAHALLKKTCDSGSLYACGELGVWYDSGEWGVERQGEISVALLRKGCSGKHGQSCAALGERLLFGYGVEGDPQAAQDMFELARSALQRSCKNEKASACHRLSLVHKLGYGAFADWNQFVEYAKRACVLGDVQSCHNAALLPTLDADLFVQALDRAKRRCGQGYADACNAAGRLARSHTLGPQDLVQARKSFEAGCALHDVRSCDSLEDFLRIGLGGEEDATQATKVRAQRRALLRSSCGQGFADHCDALSKELRTEVSSAQEQLEAHNLDLESCKQGFSFACDRLSESYKEGKVVPRDPLRSRSYKGIAMDLRAKRCDAGHNRSCRLTALDLKLSKFMEDMYALQAEAEGKKPPEPIAPNVPKDPKVFIEKAIALELKRCLELGEFGACSLAVSDLRKDPKRRSTISENIRPVLRTVCDAKVPRACDALGDTYFEDEDPKAQREAYAQACSLGLLSSCITVAETKPENKEAVETLRSQACADNIGALCRPSSGTHYEQYKTRACYSGSFYDCSQLVSWYKEQTDQDRTKEIHRFETVICKMQGTPCPKPAVP